MIGARRSGLAAFGGGKLAQALELVADRTDVLLADEEEIAILQGKLESVRGGYIFAVLLGEADVAEVLNDRTRGHVSAMRCRARGLVASTTRPPLKGQSGPSTPFGSS